jgi:hypothetical protein
MASALYFGHPGNRGDAIQWGEALGAQSAHLGAYQGHGSVATPHNILITWAVIMQGGVQVNIEGRRFCDESLGYSEQAAEVLRQPGGVVWSIFDARIAAVARQFEDFRNAERTGAIVTRQSVQALADAIHVPPEAFAALEVILRSTLHHALGQLAALLDLLLLLKLLLLALLGLAALLLLASRLPLNALLLASNDGLRLAALLRLSALLLLAFLTSLSALAALLALLLGLDTLLLLSALLRLDTLL